MDSSSREAIPLILRWGQDGANNGEMHFILHVIVHFFGIKIKTFMA